MDSRLITAEHFPLSLIHYLNEVTNPAQNEIFMVLREDENGKVLQNIERYADANPETISRPKGGIIHAMLNKRDEYDKHTHFILPIRNNNGEARFLYKAKLGHRIIQNLKVHQNS